MAEAHGEAKHLYLVILPQEEADSWDDVWEGSPLASSVSINGMAMYPVPQNRSSVIILDLFTSLSLSPCLQPYVPTPIPILQSTPYPIIFLLNVSLG